MCERCLVEGLENIPKTQLKHAGVVCGRKNVPECGREEDRSRPVSLSGIAEVGVVEYVEPVHPELQPVGIGPRHSKVLQDSHVDVPEPRTTQDVAGARSARDGGGEGTQSVVGVRKVLDRVRSATTGDGGADTFLDVRTGTDEHSRLS